MRETGATFVGDRVVVTADFNGDGTPDLANSDGTVQLTVARMTKRSNFIGIIARERNTPSQKWDGFSQKRTKWARKDRSRKWRKYL
jgi:hypothetical protein